MSTKNAKAKRKCRTKIPYKTMEAAQAAMHVVKNNSVFFMNAYKCPICKKFHIGRIKKIHKKRWKKLI